MSTNTDTADGGHSVTKLRQMDEPPPARQLTVNEYERWESSTST